ncbi:hypothetical protein B2J86_08230 [Acidovorax sp. SRB_14]|nr:hypothetical protein [Acidovorax sp. SRB_14]
MAADLRLPRVGQYLAVAFATVPDGAVRVVELQCDAGLARGLVQNAQPLGHSLLANAVTGCDGNPMRQDLPLN